MDQLPRLTDLIPRRITSLGLWTLAGGAAIALIEALYAWLPDLASYAGGYRVAAFELGRAGTLSSWYCSFLLELCGAVSIVIYLIRRHREDDYHGRYHVWLWAAMCWFLVSVDGVASLHDGFKQMMILVTGLRILGDGSIWWVIAYFFLVGSIGLRLLLDMRDCRAACVLMVLTGILAGCAVALHLNWLIIEPGARQPMVQEGVEMAADLLLLLTLTLQARHLVFDAEGLLPARATRSADATEESDEDEEPEQSSQHLTAVKFEELPIVKTSGWKVDPPHPAPQPAVSRTSSVTKPTSLVGGFSGAPSTTEKLTKADRKALRKRLEEMRKQREARERRK
jgi:hypothetical protein